MSYNKSIDSAAINTNLTNIANAIRTKSGGTSPLSFPSGFVSEINNIPIGAGSLELVKENMNIVASGNTYSGDTATLTTPLAAGDIPIFIITSSGTPQAYRVESRLNTSIGGTKIANYNTNLQRSSVVTITGSVGSSLITPVASYITGYESTMGLNYTGDLYVLHTASVGT